MKFEFKKAVVWNAHWATCGGGEGYALQLIKVLRDNGLSVLILGQGSNPSSNLHARFGVDISDIPYKSITFESEIHSYLDEETLFVNGSFGSDFIAPTKSSIYICHFPKVKFLKIKKVLELTAIGNRATRSNKSEILNHLGTAIISEPAQIFSFEESNVKLSNTLGSLVVDSNISGTLSIPSGEEYEMQNGEIVDIKLENQPNPIGFRSDNLTQRPIRSLLWNRLKKPFVSNFHDSYGQIWSNSIFTSKHLLAIWGNDSKVVYPPVQMYPQAPIAKDYTQILSVGRFFDPASGHSKNQLELVRALKTLNSKSEKKYQLNLVGGVTEKDARYFDRVKLEASGENVVFHENASLETLNLLLKTCGIFWHATGLNADQSSPEKLEHFGISLVEAMSAALVPFVFDSAGPHEILKSCPFNRFHSLSDLVSKTLEFESMSVKSKSDISSDVEKIARNFSTLKFEDRALTLIRILERNRTNDLKMTEGENE
jgi:hypothetical protein